MLKQAIKDTINHFNRLGIDPYHINCGNCDEFVSLIFEILESKGFDMSTISDMTTLNYVNDYSLPDHCWIFHENRHYDAEAPDGVDHWKKLPLFDRLRNTSYNEVLIKLPD